jgi:hypothetical protein
MLSVIYIVLVGVLFILGFFTNVKLHRHILAIFLSWLIIVLPVVFWLSWAVNNNLAIIDGSGFNLTLLLAAKLLFISTLAVYIWGWLKKGVLDFQISSIWPLLVLYFFIALAFAGLIFRQDRSLDFALYSFIVGAVLISLSRLIYSLRFCLFQLSALVIFVLVAFVNYLIFQDSFFDDFNFANVIFGFSFVGLFIVVFNWFDEKWSPGYVVGDSAINLHSPVTKSKGQSSFAKKEQAQGYQITADLINKKNESSEPNIVKHGPSSKPVRPSTKLANTFYDLRNRRRKDYIIQESYFKMPNFTFEQQSTYDKNSTH